MRFTLPVIAVGGSNGKTTTKEMIARVLRQRYKVLSTEGNLNNQIGVPHTLFRLEKKHEVAVVEVGTNHAGEIAYLCDILQPTHGVITNIGKEHLEYFNGIEGVAQEEGSLFASLRMRKGGISFVNVDDAMVVAQAKGMRRKFTYGMTRSQADLHGTVLGFDRAGCARLRIKAKRRATSLTMRLRVPGVTNAANALAAAAVGIHFRIAPKHLGKALESFTAASKRMEVVRIDGITVLNDTYNANPDSTLAALGVLARAATKGKKIAVLADMLELGAHAADEHARVGREATELGVDYLLTYGTLARHIHKAAGVEYRMHYDNKNVLAEYLAELVTPGDLVLVKGSRGMKMEDVVTFLRERLQAQGS
jgi:UDP-N-acetylmuramoyl-tripeptide--D-alanyl-D-alanine ligase